MLRLDPIADREEYGALIGALDEWKPSVLTELEASGGQDGRRLVARARNLGVLDWNLWSREAEGSILQDATDPAVRCLVVDLGSLATREEQALAAEAVLVRLWEHRADRAPVLIVIDEAHNVCPADPEDPLTTLATEYAVRIAGRRPEVRPLPARLDPAAAEGARERAQPVRQPAPHADELDRRPRLRRRRLLLRPAQPARAGDRLSPGRVAGRRQDLALPRAPPLRRARQRGGRRRRPLRLGRTR